MLKLILFIGQPLSGENKQVLFQIAHDSFSITKLSEYRTIVLTGRKVVGENASGNFAAKTMAPSGNAVHKMAPNSHLGNKMGLDG